MIINTSLLGNYPQVDFIKNKLDAVTVSSSDKTFCTTSDDSSSRFSLEREWLTDNFSFRSVYNQGNGQYNEATTFQDQWVTVDYIFYRYASKGLLSYTI